MHLLQRFWRSREDDCPGSIRDSEGKTSEGAEVEFDSSIEMGKVLAAKGMHAEALKQFERSLKVSPESALAYRYAAQQALVLDDFHTARDHLVLALHYAPSDVECACLLVQSYIDHRDYTRGRKLILQFLNAHGDNAELLFEAARCEYLDGNFDLAKTWLSRLLKSHPEQPFALNLLGLIAAREYGDLAAGEDLIRRALKASPAFKDAWSNLGWVASERGHIEQALLIFDRVLGNDGADSETRLMRAYANLKHGRFRAGWEDFESRHASPLAFPGTYSFPVLPHGRNPDGLSLLVYEEQGLGDQIMFSSCIPDLVAAGAFVTIQCDMQLKTLFSRSFSNCCVIGQHEAVPAGIDYQIAIGSLPGMYRNRVEDFPAHKGYLHADVERVAYWRRKLQSLGAGPYVGISWRGGVKTTRQQLRSFPLVDWMPLFGKSGQFVSLQYGDCSEVEALGQSNLCHWPEAITNYDDTAALVFALDMVVSVCTAVVHLAGALGTQVYVLTPSQPEWRYLYEGEKMPWYPAARLFRQGQNEPWHAVMARFVQFMREEEEAGTTRVC